MRYNLEVQFAVDLARQFISDDRWAQTPVDVRQVAKELGVQSVVASALNIDGYLAHDAAGNLAIRYRSANSEQRNRFTIAHELGHLLLAKVQGKEISRSNRAPTRDPREEFAVNRIGAELLMPESIILKELRSRVGQTPWRILTVLKHSLHVSESAIALRMLELKFVACVLFRIDITRALDGRSGRYPLDVSEHGKLRVVGDVPATADRLWAEAARGTLHTIDVEVNGRAMRLPCEGVRRAIRTKAGVTHQYWVTGWITARPAIPSMDSRAGGRSLT